MSAIPFATLSVQHFINSVGADAGFAAIIGLAILVLLYFAQARETSSLRDQVEDSADLIQHLEHRIEQLGRAGVAPAPAAATPGVAPAPGTVAPARPGTIAPGVVAPAPPGAIRPVPAPAIAAARAGAAPVSARMPAPVPVGAAPAAPAGVGAPALSAATRLIPADAGPIQLRANGGERTAAPVAAGAVATPSGPPPMTAAGGANGTAGRAPVAPPPSAGNTGAQPPLRAPARAEATAAGRAPVGPPRRSPMLPPRSSGPAGRSRFSRAAIGIVTLLGVIAVVVVLLIVTSGGGGSPKTGASSSSSSSATASTPSGSKRSRHTTAAALTPAAVAVTVLNGTATPKLASTIAAKLAAAGFKQGTAPTNATDQTHTATIVAYLPHDKAAALLVARTLKLGPASVQPVDQSSQAVACQTSSTPCTTKVVVTVGSDLASNT